MRFLKPTIFTLTFLLVAVFFSAHASAATQVFYSVGQSTANLMTGTPTVTIASGTATFSVAQTGNIGVGDRVTYNTSDVAYIASKTSTSVWTLVTKTGAIPPDITNSTLVSITREYTSLAAAEAGATDANHLNTTDLVTSNYQLNLPCYYDTGADTTAVTVSGYTSGVSNYIKIYTPNNTASESNISQRHQGKWDDGKYRMAVSSTWFTMLTLSQQATVIEGIQIDGNYNYQSKGVQSSGVNSSTNSIIRGNIFKQFGTYNDEFAINIAYSNNVAVSNNIIYDCSGVGIYINNWTNSFIYNNTIVNCDIGIVFEGPNTPPTLKNNISVNNSIDYNVYSGSFHASSSNNISSDATAPGTNSKINTTVAFADFLNKDFHLLPTDTAAKNAGADLSADPNFAFITDIDGQTRPSSSSTAWDIGADEAATPIYYSVGQNTNDHKTGSPTMDIAADGTATFSVAQTATNLGVGDKVTYNTSSVAYISAKSSTTQWKLITATGATPASVTGATVNSIAHAFASLNQAIVGSGSNHAGDSAHLNTMDLIAGNYQLNIPCYYDTGADTVGGALISTYTTSKNNFIKIYTPSNTATEVNRSQQHRGVFDNTKFYLTNDLTITNGNVVVDGLQAYHVSGIAINAYGGGGSGLIVKNNLIQGDTGTEGGVQIGNAGAGTSSYIFNNIILDINGGGRGSIVRYYDGDNTAVYVYNNTVSGAVSTHASSACIANFSGAVVVAKNNLVLNCGGTVNGSYHGTFALGTDYNATDSSDSIGQGSNNKINQTFQFVDAANKNFHLFSADTAAHDSGTNLNADQSLHFDTDIDGQGRIGAWDIGADELTETQIEKTAPAAPNVENGLIGHWTFDGKDVSGSIAKDISGNNNDGVISGAVLAAGKLGQGVNLNGSNGRVAISNFQFSVSNKLSISQWVNFQALATARPIVSQWGVNNNILLKTDDTNSNQIRVCVAASLADNCTNYAYTTDVNFAINSWNQMQIVYDGTQVGNAEILKFYLNGVQKTLVFVGTIPTILQNPNSTLEIGGDSDLVQYLSGKIDDVRIYNRALSTQEIGILYNQGQIKVSAPEASKGDTNGLVGHWSFDGGTINGVAVNDLSGSGNNGTISGATPTSGKLGQGMGFNGTSSFVNVGSSASLDDIETQGGGGLSVSAWIKPLGLGEADYNAIAVKGDVTEANSWAFFSRANFLVFAKDYAGASDLILRTTDLVSFGTWQHVVATWNGGSAISDAHIYLNGAEAGYFAGGCFNGEGLKTSDSLQDLYIGNGKYSSRTFNGSIDEVRIYSRVLSTQEIGNLYKAGIAEIRK